MKKEKNDFKISTLNKKKGDFVMRNEASIRKERKKKLERMTK